MTCRLGDSQTVIDVTAGLDVRLFDADAFHYTTSGTPSAAMEGRPGRAGRTQARARRFRSERLFC